MRLVSIVLLGLLAACARVPIESSPPAAAMEYRLGAGDRLRVTVFDEPKLTGEFVVDGTGMIAYPLLGQITAASSTTIQLRDAIETQLAARFVRNPKVSVEVINYRPVYILGEVTRPGEYPFAERMSALALVAKAGGFTFRANQRAIFIRHEGDAGEHVYSLAGGLMIQPGDTVRIGERYF